MSRSLSALKNIVSPENFLNNEADLSVYAYDGALERAKPDAVLLPQSVQEVQKIVSFCAQNKIPFTGRGAGTNLSGGCIPLKGGIIISLARLDRILEIDTKNSWAVVEPGVVNGVLQKELEKAGFFYPPDPASLKISTLGGNIAENAGGPRCLKYGTTTNYVLALEAVMPDGTLEIFDLKDGGPEILSLLIGSEGTLGLVTKAVLKICPLPPSVMTFLAGFNSIDSAVACVSTIVASGLVPRVLEAMDKTTVESIEGYLSVGYPKADAVLLIEIDGSLSEVRRDAQMVEEFCRRFEASSFRAATDPEEREKLWEGRRGAYAAMARLAPNVLVEDGVVPRDKLAQVVSKIQEIIQKHQVKAGLLFHAGDGNIHPNIAYDERDLEQTKKAKQAGFEMLKACVELGGSISGEHGIGSDKRQSMAWLFEPAALEIFRRIKTAFDPNHLANPDKIIPLPEEEKNNTLIVPPRKPPTDAAAHLIKKVSECARAKQKMRIQGSASKTDPAWKDPNLCLIETAGLNRILEIDRGNQTVTFEAGISAYELQTSLAALGFYLKLPPLSGTMGGFLATKSSLGLRDSVLGMRLLLADGSVASFGGKVVKNVAGYDVCRALIGSWGSMAVILEATFKIHASAQKEIIPVQKPQPLMATNWSKRLKTAFDPENLLNPWFFQASL